jgi:hypothetical protein
LAVAAAVRQKKETGRTKEEEEANKGRSKEIERLAFVCCQRVVANARPLAPPCGNGISNNIERAPLTAA